MKKALTYTLAAVLLLASLTACGKQADDSASTDTPQQLSADQTAYDPENPFQIDTAKFDKVEFLKCCESAYNKVWRNPDINYYEFKYSTTYLEIELKWLNFFTESEAGITCTETEEAAYTAWRNATHPEPRPEFKFEEYPTSIKVSEDAPYVGDTVLLYSEPCMHRIFEIDHIAKGEFIGKAEATYGSNNEPVWFKFEYNGNTVYLQAECTDDCQDSDYIDTEESEDELFKSVNEVVYATEKVNIRESYSAASTKLGQLTRGQSVTRIGVGQGEVSDWSQVRLSDGTTAYINSKYLSTTKPATSSNSNKPSSSQGSGVHSSQGNSGGSTSSQGNSGGSVEPYIPPEFLDNNPINTGDGTPPEYSSDTSGIDTSKIRIHG